MKDRTNITDISEQKNNKGPSKVKVACGTLVIVLTLAAGWGIRGYAEQDAIAIADSVDGMVKNPTPEEAKNVLPVLQERFKKDGGPQITPVSNINVKEVEQKINNMDVESAQKATDQINNSGKVQGKAGLSYEMKKRAPGEVLLQTVLQALKIKR